MNFKEKYTNSELKAKDEKEKKKTELTNDAYAIGEMIEELKGRIASLGRTLMIK